MYMYMKPYLHLPMLYPEVYICIVLQIPTLSTAHFMLTYIAQ